MDPTLAALCRAACGDFANLPAPDPRRRSIPHLLAGLLERRSDTLCPEEIESLTQLCLKVDVTRGVRDHYKQNWKPPKGAPALADRYWHGLLVTLMIGSQAEIPTNDDHHDEYHAGGFRLKCLNALFTAADLLGKKRDAETRGDAAIEDIVRWAREQLESELACPSR